MKGLPLPQLLQQVDAARLLIDKANAGARTSQIAGFSLLFPRCIFVVVVLFQMLRL